MTMLVYLKPVTETILCPMLHFFRSVGLVICFSMVYLDITKLSL